MLVEIIGVMIPIILFLIIGAIVITSVYLKYRRRKEMFALYHQERMAAIEKGMDLPPMALDFLHADRSYRAPRSPRRVLLTGLVWLFGGATAFFALQGWQEDIPSRIALIPAAIGLAMVVYYVLVGRKEAQKMEADANAAAGQNQPPKY